MDFQDLLPENIMEQFKNEKDKRRKPIHLEKFSDWVLSFALFAAVIAEKEPGRGLELFQYLGVVTRLARDSPGFQWLEYDKQFRSTAAASESQLKWSSVDQDCLQWARQLKWRRQGRGCDRWNSGKFCANSTCKFDHVCNKCGRDHPAVRCLRKERGYQSRPYTTPTKANDPSGGFAKDGAGK